MDAPANSVRFILLSGYEIKQFVSNSITYSFMTKNEKEQGLKLLQKKFDEFEHKIVTIMDMTDNR